MSHDDIRAALESRTDLPWRPSHDGPVATRPSDTYDVLDNDGETVAASLFYLDAHLIANAPTWLAELLGEVGLLRTLKHRHEQTITELAARAEAAEATVRRVRGLAGELRAKHYLAPTATADAILRALDGGEQ